MGEAKFMVDRVAEAIARAAVEQKEPDFHLQAIAAICAMREPTEDMQLVGADIAGNSNDGAAIIWKSMVDAALGKVPA